MKLKEKKTKQKNITVKPIEKIVKKIVKKKSKKLNIARRVKLLRPVQPRAKRIVSTLKKGNVIESDLLKTKINILGSKLKNFTLENTRFSKPTNSNAISISAASPIENKFDYRLNILVKANNVFCNFSSFNKKFYKKNWRQYKATCTSGKYKIRMSKGNKLYVYNQVVTKFMKEKVRPIFLRKLQMKYIFKRNKSKRFSKQVKQLNNLTARKPILLKRRYLLQFLLKNLWRASRERLRLKIKLQRRLKKVKLLRKKSLKKNITKNLNKISVRKFRWKKISRRKQLKKYLKKSYRKKTNKLYIKNRKKYYSLAKRNCINFTYSQLRTIKQNFYSIFVKKPKVKIIYVDSSKVSKRANNSKINNKTKKGKQKKVPVKVKTLKNKLYDKRISFNNTKRKTFLFLLASLKTNPMSVLWLRRKTKTFLYRLLRRKVKLKLLMKKRRLQGKVYRKEKIQDIAKFRFLRRQRGIIKRFLKWRFNFITKKKKWTKSQKKQKWYKGMLRNKIKKKLKWFDKKTEKTKENTKFGVLVDLKVAKKMVKTLLNNLEYHLSYWKIPYVIRLHDKKIFNGCRAPKKMRKKRKRSRVKKYA